MIERYFQLNDGQEKILVIQYLLKKMVNMFQLLNMQRQVNKHAFNQPGQRVWDIYLGKKKVKQNYDPYQAAGDIHSASNVYIPFLFKNQKIFFDDEECVSAYNDKRQAFLLYFKHVGKDNPMVNGIILFKGKLEETDFYKQDAMKKMYEYQYDKQKRQNIYEQKYLKTRSLAKMKHKKRNDNILIVEDFDQVFIEEELSNKVNYYFIIGLFISSFLIGLFTIDVIKGVNEAKIEEEHKKKSQLNINLSMKTFFYFCVLIQVPQWSLLSYNHLYHPQKFSKFYIQNLYIKYESFYQNQCQINESQVEGKYLRRQRENI